MSRPKTVAYDDIDFHVANCNKGLRVLLAFHWNATAPCAWVTYYPEGTTRHNKPEAVLVHVYFSEVDAKHRRRGLRMHLQRKIFEHHKATVIITSSGTQSGEAWMRQAGYRKVTNGLWMVTKREFDKAYKAWEKRRENRGER